MICQYSHNSHYPLWENFWFLCAASEKAELAPHLKSAISVTCPRLSTRWDLGGRLHHEGLLPSAGDLHEEQQCYHLHPLLQPGAGNQRPQRFHPTEHMPVSPAWEDGRPRVLRPHQISPLTLKAKLQFKSETASLFSHSLLKYTDILFEVKLQLYFSLKPVPQFQNSLLQE